MVSSIAIGSKSFIFSPLLELEKPYSPQAVIKIRNEVRRHATTGNNNVNFPAVKFKGFTWLHHNMNNYPKFGRKFITIVPEDGSNKQIGRATGSGGVIDPEMTAVLNGIIAALGSHNRIGVYGSNSRKKADLLQTLWNRARQNNLFDDNVLVSMPKKPNIKNIRDAIAKNLKRGKRILIYLHDLPEGIDLSKIGIPADHPGCKIVVTSTSQTAVQGIPNFKL